MISNLGALPVTNALGIVSFHGNLEVSQQVISFKRSRSCTEKRPVANRLLNLDINFLLNIVLRVLLIKRSLEDVNINPSFLHF